MIPIESLTTFVIASVLLALAPGPDNIFVLTMSSVNGSKAGLSVTLGLCTGLLVHTSAVALGLAALFKTSYAAFTTVKIIGALYLLYLAWQAFRASSHKIQNSQARKLTGLQFYFRGLVMNVANPKVTIFFLAFLPQFTNPDYGPVVQQVFLLGTVFIFVTLVIFGGVAVLSGSVGSWLNRSPQTQIIMNRLAGMVFVIMALKLATANMSS